MTAACRNLCMLCAQKCPGTPRLEAVPGRARMNANTGGHCFKLNAINTLIHQPIQHDDRDHPVLLRNTTSTIARVTQAAKGHDFRRADDVRAH